jgi:AcrR family transcriptional regulator
MHGRRPGERPPGRPRSEQAKAAILAAAHALLQQDGFRAMSVEAIATRAGVSKATIYRWWPNKAAVVMDAFLAATSPQMPFPQTGSTHNKLTRQLSCVVRLFNDPAVARPFVALITESAHDPELAAALRGGFITARREAAREVFTAGIRRGELHPDLDIDVAIDALYGALYYRLLVSGAPLTLNYAHILLEQLYPAFTARP